MALYETNEFLEIVITDGAAVRETNEFVEIVETDGADIQAAQIFAEVVIEETGHSAEFEDSVPVGSDDIGVSFGFPAEFEDSAPVAVDEIGANLTLWMGAAFEDSAPVAQDAFKAPFGIQVQLEDSVPVGSDDIDTQLGIFSGTEFIVLANLYFDDGVYRTSWPTAVRNQDTWWDGRILKFGSIERSIEIPSGLTRVGDGSMTIADPDQSMRLKLSSYQPRGKLIDLLLIPVGGSTLTAQRIYKGEITKVTFPEGQVTFQFSDRTFRFFTEKLPFLITENNFTDLPESESYEAFAPIILGECNSSLLGDQGCVDCPQVDSANKKYCVARHQVEDVIAVYKKAAGEEIYSEVTSGYSVTTGAKTIDDVEYTFTYIEFSSDQGDGTKIRVDAKGLMVVDSDGDGVMDQSSRNLSLNLKKYLDLFVEETLEIDQSSFDTLETTFDELTYYCDGYISDSLTHREVISQMVSSFNVDFYQNRHGQIAVHLTDDVNAPEKEMTDNFHFLKDTLMVATPDPVCTKIRYKYGLQPSGKYFGEGSVENENFENTIGKKIEKVHEMPFCRDYSTAESVASHVLNYLVEDAHRIYFDLDAPKNIDVIDLTEILGVTHYGGLGAGGYDNESFKVFNISFDVQDLRFKIGAIRPMALPDPGGVEMWGTPSYNSINGPHIVGNKIYTVCNGGLSSGISDCANNPYEPSDLLVWGTSSYLDGLELKDSLRLDNDFKDGGMDSVLDLSNGYIHIVTFDDGGYIYYHRFNLNLNSFDIEKKLIDTSVANQSGTDFHTRAFYSNHYERSGCSIEVATDGSVHLVYTGTETSYDPADGTYTYEEATPGTYHFDKMFYTRSTDHGSSWSTPAIVGDESAHYDCCNSAQRVGRLKAISNGKVGLFFMNKPLYEDYGCCQVYPTITGAKIWYAVNAVVYPEPYPHPRIVEAEEDDCLYIACKAYFGRMYVYAFPRDLVFDGVEGQINTISDQVTNKFAGSTGDNIAGGQADYPQAEIIVKNGVYVDTIWSDSYDSIMWDTSKNHIMPPEDDAIILNSRLIQRGSRDYLVSIVSTLTATEYWHCKMYLRIRRWEDYTDAGYATFADWVAGEVS